MPSKQVPFRLSESDRAKIGAIREHFGLPSDAAAVRYAINRAAERVRGEVGKKGGKKDAAR